MSNKHIYLYT